jgi:nucleoside-diphosphate-sugar epimerase
MSTLIVGCGYLGLQVARKLHEIQPSSEIYGTTRSPTRFAKIEEAGAKPIPCEVLDPASVATLPDTSDIVHCVSMGRKQGESLPGMAQFLAELARRKWAGRLIHVSTTSVYGQTDGSWVTEESPADPTTDSGRVALDLEALVRNGLPEQTITIRMAGLYGLGRIIQRSAVEQGEAIGGDPNRWLNLIHVSDATDVVVGALRTAQASRMYLGCDNRPITRAVYYNTLAELIGAPAPRWKPSNEGEVEPNKRVSNRKMREELGVDLRHPTIFEGLKAALPTGLAACDVLPSRSAFNPLL